MTTPARRRLRTTHRALWYALAAVLVLLALGAVVASRLLPLAERHPQRVEAWLSERAGHPVGFDRLETEWTRRGPLLRLGGLRIGAGDDVVTVGAAEVLVAQYAGLLPGRSLTELRLRELALTLERDRDGRWRVHGLPGERQEGDPFDVLQRLGELQVIGGSLTVLAPDLGLEATVPRIDLRMRVDGRRVRAAARAWMREGEVPVRAVLRLDRGSGDGRVYAGLQGGDLDGWSPLLRYAQVAVDDGHGRAQAWAELEGFRIAGVAARLALEGVGLSGAAGSESATPARVDFERLDAELVWRGTGDGWRLDAPRLRLDDGRGERRMDGVSAAFGSRYALVAERIEAGPLLALLTLGEGVPAGLRAWLGEASPDAVLTGVEVAGERGGRLRARARVASAGFASVGDRPGLSGLAGDLHGDAEGALFVFDPQARMRFDWPSGFGVAHELSLQGEAAAWRARDGWEVQTPALRVQGEGYGAHVRGGLRFEAGGGRPWIDLAARVDETEVSMARGFWVRHLMPDKALEWLDDALVAGRVRNGRAVISGDLDDWPFGAASGRASSGLFHAEGEIVDATLRFQPGWPVAERIAGHVRFIGRGFDFRGSGAIAGIPAADIRARIPDFGRAELALTTRTATDAGRVLALLRESPLPLDYLEGLALSGAVEGDFGMRLPMHGNGGGPRIEGAMTLSGVEASEPEWRLAFQDIRGELRYDEQGISAPSLRTRVEGRGGLLSLRGGDGHVREPGRAFEGELRAGMAADALLARVPELDWLRPHARGHSGWNLALTVGGQDGADAAAPAGVLRLQSDLVGTALALPAPLDKPATTPLPTRIEVPLPLGSGEVSVRMGQRVAVRARIADAGTAVRVTLGGAAAAPPPSGLAIDGRTPSLATVEWAGLAAGRDAQDGGLALQDIDLQVGRLLLAGGSFADVHIRAAAADSGRRLQFDGDTLAGALTLPQAAGAEVRGEFARMHWRPLGNGRAAAQQAPDGPEAQARGDGADPAVIPPIRLSVEDLRVDRARLGNASLVTLPVPGGMRIEQLATRSQNHRIDASGYWSGRGEGERTRVSFRLDSRDFGELAAGVGQQERIRGGEGHLALEAAWPGSPAGFGAPALDGSLRLELRNGQLVDLEPGAGRVLGLLSVAELPRRLALDFRDFFDRGFAFNQISGEVRAAAGRAASDNLVIDGPAAEIRIAGVADLRAQTYDQTIDVYPKSGNLLTAVGAIAGGPVGAAVGAMANAVLRKPLSELGASTYRVTGPWAEPKVEVIRREAPPMAERERVPPTGGSR